jgi:type IV secretory pathway protease TraF
VTATSEVSQAEVLGVDLLEQNIKQQGDGCCQRISQQSSEIQRLSCRWLQCRNIQKTHLYLYVSVTHASENVRFFYPLMPADVGY